MDGVPQHLAKSLSSLRILPGSFYQASYRSVAALVHLGGADLGITGTPYFEEVLIVYLKRIFVSPQ